jgi:predicted dithiol-disulfide oxidoreductase (DUF899 family)
MNKGTTIDFERELAEAEEELVKAKERLAELRRQLPKEEVKDYALKAWDGGEARLSRFFGDKKDLILIHNMGTGCSYCTMWADGFNGVFHHLENRAGFVVVSPNDPETQKKFAASRGWKFKMYSAKGTSFNKDMGFENEKGGAQPGVSVFRKEPDGKIFRVSKAEFGPGDDFCAVWHLFDLLAEGPAGWEPKFSY